MPSAERPIAPFTFSRAGMFNHGVHLTWSPVHSSMKQYGYLSAQRLPHANVDQPVAQHAAHKHCVPIRGGGWEYIRGAILTTRVAHAPRHHAYALLRKAQCSRCTCARMAYVSTTYSVQCAWSSGNLPSRTKYAAHQHMQTQTVPVRCRARTFQLQPCTCKPPGHGPLTDTKAEGGFLDGQVGGKGGAPAEDLGPDVHLNHPQGAAQVACAGQAVQEVHMRRRWASKD